jgi:hypothetical protein
MLPLFADVPRSSFIVILLLLTVPAIGCTSDSPAAKELDDLSFKDLPAPSLSEKGGGYKADPYIRAASILQKTEREKAINKLQELAKVQGVIVLCRMLFTSKPGSEFRRPLLGAPEFIGAGPWSPWTGDANLHDWPLEPIALVDGVPFLIVGGYWGTGVAEPPEQYLRYCLEECAWSTYQFELKSDAQKAAALKKLLSSKALLGRIAPCEVKQLESQIK